MRSALRYLWRSRWVRLVALIVGLSAMLGLMLVILRLLKPERFAPRPVLRLELLANSTAHFVPHTHLDLGWIYTEQQYYSDSVREILDSCFEHLSTHPTAKMVYSDFGFLRMHLERVADRAGEIKLIRSLVQRGQLELLNGGFVLNDFATVTFDEMLSNYQYGRKFVQELTGELPRTGWNIDQFGQTVGAMRLLKQLGYEQNVITRMPTEDKKLLSDSRGLLLRWGFSKKPEDFLVNYVFKGHYETFTPMHFRQPYSWSLPDKPLVPDITHFKFNLDTVFFELIEAVVIEWAASQPTSHTAIPYGGDFYFKNFKTPYEALELLVILINSNAETGIFAGRLASKISTVGEYFAAVKQEMASKNLSIIEHLQYYNKTAVPLVEFKRNATNRVAWSGYYSSYPVLKKAVRSYGELQRGLRSLLVFVQLSASSVPPGELASIVNKTRESEWVAAGNYHHDTITGTSRHAVNSNYFARMQVDMRVSRLAWKPLLKRVVKLRPARPDEQPTAGLHEDRLADANFESEYAKPRIRLEDVTRAEQLQLVEDGWSFEFTSPVGQAWQVDEGSDFLLAAQAHGGRRVMRIWSSHELLRISDLTAQRHVRQTTVKSLVDFRFEHMFIAEFKPFDAKIYRVEPFIAAAKLALRTLLKKDHVVRLQATGTTIAFVDGHSLNLHLQDGDSLRVGLYRYVVAKKNELEGELMPDEGDYEKFKREPGKYAFRTNLRDAQVLMPDTASYWEDADMRVASVRLEYTTLGCSVELQYFADAPASHRLSSRIEYTKRSKKSQLDLVVRYSTGIESGRRFFTDSNGLLLLEREFGDLSPFVECNYYPVTKFVGVADSRRRFSVLPDRPVGATSRSPGEVELMITRHTLTDDSRGASEHCHEELSASLLHWLVFEPLDSSLFRQNLILEDLAPLVFRLGLKPQQPPSVFEALQRTPDDAQADDPDPAGQAIKLVFDTSDGSDFFVRVYNYGDSPRQVDVADLVQKASGVRVSSAEEWRLDLNSKLGEARTEQWPGDFDQKRGPEVHRLTSMEASEARAFKLFL